MRNIAGSRFGRLTAISRESRRTNGRVRTFWMCHCDCGTDKAISMETLIRGDCNSCGCLQKEKAAQRMTTHGGAGTRLYRIWCGMINRCTNPKAAQFRNYGGRGITICDAWRHSFETFAAAVGEPPTSSHSIDRWRPMGAVYTIARYARRGSVNRVKHLGARKPSAFRRPPGFKFDWRAGRYRQETT